MKIIGILVLILALYQMKISIDACTSEAHWSFRTEEKLLPVIEPILSSMTSKDSQEKQKQQIIDAACAISGESVLKLIKYGFTMFWLELIQAILGTMIIVLSTRKKANQALQPTPSGVAELER